MPKVCEAPGMTNTTTNEDYAWVRTMVDDMTRDNPGLEQAFDQLRRPTTWRGWTITCEWSGR